MGEIEVITGKAGKMVVTKGRSDRILVVGMVGMTKSQEKVMTEGRGARVVVEEVEDSEVVVVVVVTGSRGMILGMMVTMMKLGIAEVEGIGMTEMMMETSQKGEGVVEEEEVGVVVLAVVGKTIGEIKKMGRKKNRGSGIFLLSPPTTKKPYLAAQFLAATILANMTTFQSR